MAAKRIPQLAPNGYKAAQRAIKNIWFGTPAPIAEAAETEGAPEASVVETLSTFALLIMDALGEQFDKAPWLRRYEQRLYEELATKAKALPTLRADVERLRREYYTLENEATRLRHENERLAEQRKKMRTRIANHESMMVDLTRQFEAAVKHDLRGISKTPNRAYSE